MAAAKNTAHRRLPTYIMYRSPQKGSVLMLELDRVRLKEEARGILLAARVSPYLFALLYLVLTDVLKSVQTYTSGSLVNYMQRVYPGLPVPDFLLRAASLPSYVPAFVTAVTFLLGALLEAGFALYHLGVRRGEEQPYATLFGAFDQAGRVILLAVIRGALILLGSMLFFIPGIILSYRYSFAMYDLMEDPELRPVDALRMSAAQTYGFKWALFLLDLSFLGWWILSAFTMGLLYIWVAPYYAQTVVGYFQTIKRAKGIGHFPAGEEPCPGGGDPFGPAV